MGILEDLTQLIEQSFRANVKSDKPGIYLNGSFVTDDTSPETLLTVLSLTSENDDACVTVKGDIKKPYYAVYMNVTPVFISNSVIECREAFRTVVEAIISLPEEDQRNVALVELVGNTLIPIGSKVLTVR